MAPRLVFLVPAFFTTHAYLLKNPSLKEPCSRSYYAPGAGLLKLCCKEVIYFEIALGQESVAGRLVVAGIPCRCYRSAQTPAESDHIQVCQRHRMPTVQQRRRDPRSPPVFRISTQVLQKLRCQLWSILGLHEGSPSFVFCCYSFAVLISFDGGFSCLCLHQLPRRVIHIGRDHYLVHMAVSDVDSLL